MKKFLLSFFCAISLFSSQVEIKSQSVVADDSKGVTTFAGEVHITRGQDLMRADKVQVFLDKNRDIEKFEADGNTSFSLNLENNQSFRGKADSFIYYPIRQEFYLTGDAVLEDMSNKRKLIGEKIIFDEKSKTASISGKTKEPVKVIFNISDANESQQ